MASSFGFVETIAGCNLFNLNADFENYIQGAGSLDADFTDMVEKVSIKAVDSDRIEKDDSFPKAYAFYIVLTGSPDPIWVELFISRYESTFYNLKREMTIHGSEIRVVTAPGEEENQVRFFRQIVEETNKDIDEYNKKLSQAEARDRALREREDVEAQKIKERLKKISIG